MSSLRNILQRCARNASILGGTPLRVHRVCNFNSVYTDSNCSCSAIANESSKNMTPSAQKSSFGQPKTPKTDTGMASTPTEFGFRKRHDVARTIIVNNLAPFTVEESISGYFSRFGTVTGCNVYRNLKTGQSKKFSFVEFETSAQVEKTLYVPHMIDGREVFVVNDSTQKLIDNYRIFVGGLSRGHPDTSSETLRQYFSQFGDVFEGHVVRWDNEAQYNESRGFGFVTFKSQESVDKVLSSKSHYIDGKMLTVRKAGNKNKTSGTASSAETEPSSPAELRTILVTGLSKFTTEYTVSSHFCQFGTVVRCKLEKHKDTGLSREFCFIEFETIEQAKNALKSDPPILNGKKVYMQMRRTEDFNDKYRFFVGPLPKTTSEESVRQYFSKFGEIFNCNLVRNENNSSRGFAYVTFTSHDSVERVLNETSHYIDDRLVHVEFSRSRKKEFRLLISDLPPNMTKEMLSAFYSKYGQLRECSVRIDHKTGKSRQFGHVTFSSKEEVDRAMADQPHFVDGIKLAPVFMLDKSMLFINYLSPKTTEYSLETFFSRYGRVKRCRLIRDQAGIRAVVKFYSANETQKAVDDRPHYIDDKLVLSFQKGHDYTVFVDNLPKSATENELCDLFSKFGKVVHWQIGQGRSTGKPVGYGYVTFSTAEEAVSATKSTLMLDGKPLTVTPLIKDEFQERLFD